MEKKFDVGRKVALKYRYEPVARAEQYSEDGGGSRNAIEAGGYVKTKGCGNQAISDEESGMRRMERGTQGTNKGRKGGRGGKNGRRKH